MKINHMVSRILETVLGSIYDYGPFEIDSFSPNCHQEALNIVFSAFDVVE